MNAIELFHSTFNKTVNAIKEQSLIVSTTKQARAAFKTAMIEGKVPATPNRLGVVNDWCNKHYLD